MKPFKIPFGPQHPGLEEPINFMFEVEDERVVDVKPRLGYVHGICSFAHALCYTQTVEELLGIDVPLRAKFIRTIMAEMERIQNHYLWLGLTLFMYAWRDREAVLGILEMISGKRVNYGMTTIGGVRRDITEEMTERIEKVLTHLETRAKYYKNVCTRDRTILKRTVGIGILKPRDAVKTSERTNHMRRTPRCLSESLRTAVATSLAESTSESTR